MPSKGKIIVRQYYSTLIIALAVAVLVLAMASVFTVWPELLFKLDEKERYLIGKSSVNKTQLLRTYHTVSYTIFWFTFLIASLYLITCLILSTSKPIILVDKNTIGAGLRALFHNPVTVVLLVCYTALMYYGTSYYYPEIVGWYSGVYTQDLLDNFRLNEQFIRETMGRNDYRFYPLGHQDLHLLSWFTPYVKVWIIVSALQLFTIIYFSSKLINKLVGEDIPYLFLGASILFLFHVSTANTFFQFIYAERMLVFFFSIFAYCYYNYRKSREERYFYATLLTALFGIFFKDTAFILFGGLPFFAVVLDLLGGLKTTRSRLRSRDDLTHVLSSYRIEFAIAGLVISYLFLYIILSVLRSIAKGEGAYNDAGQHLRLDIRLTDIRIWLIFLVMVFRSYFIATKKDKANILDSLNATALVYILANSVLTGFSSYSYIALPVYYVALLNILYIVAILYKHTKLRMRKSLLLLIVITGFTAIFLLESYRGVSFVSTVTHLKNRQSSWEMTYQKVGEIARVKFEQGDEANIIYTKSWFANNRHLDRLRYHRLIYLDPSNHKYVVKDGIDPGAYYTPKKGDILINIDQSNLDFIEEELTNYKIIYEYEKGRGNAKIFEFK